MFTKLLNLDPGTHHMRFFVSNARQFTAESYEARLSATLPTSTDPAGILANYVVVAPLNTRGIVRGKLEVGEGGGAAVKPLEPGHSFWSKDSEDQDSDREHDAEELNRQKEIDGQRRERDKSKAGWTNEVPLEVIHAADQEDRYLEPEALPEDGEPGWSPSWELWP